MKYYKSELWKEMQSNSNNEKNKKLWETKSKEYNEYFKVIKKQLPKYFINIYEKEHCFHDFYITGFRVEEVLQKTSSNFHVVYIEITDGNNSYMLKLNHVEKIKMNLADKCYFIMGRMSWGYSEFEILSDRMVKLSVLCDILNEFEVVFKSLKLIKID